MPLIPGNPILGGDVLRRAAIVSPNFDEANPTASPTPSWGILQSGLAYFFGLILSGGTIEGPDYIINSDGAFFYSGTPAAGNLISSVTSATGVDKFGNSYVEGFGSYGSGVTGELTGATLSLLSGATLEVQLSASGLEVFNSSGAVIFNLNVPGDAWLLYADTGSHTQGALIASASSKGGTDQFLNTYVAGIAAYSASRDTLYAQVTAAVLQFADTVNAAFFPGTIGLATIVNGNDTLLLEAPMNLSTDVQPQLGLVRAASGGMGLVELLNSGLNLRAALASSVQPASGFTLFGDGNGFPRVKVALAGDTNGYFCLYSLASASAVPQTISQTSPAVTITGCSFPVGIGKYAFKARILFHGGNAAGTARFQLGAPSTSSEWLSGSFVMNGGQANCGFQAASLSFVQSPTLTTTPGNVADLEGEFVTTVAGTVTLQAFEGSAGDSVIIDDADFWLYPQL